MRVEVVTYPESATVYGNGIKISKVSHLKPGRYTFRATANGFDDTSTTVEVSEDNRRIGISLAPKEGIKTSVEEQYELEAIAGQQAQSEGRSITQANPLIQKLPHVSVAGPYRIDYGFSDRDNLGVFYYINTSTPRGRQSALQWIRDQGFNPATLDIRYDIENLPLTGRGLE